jgi:hypothetical protein
MCLKKPVFAGVSLVALLAVAALGGCGAPVAVLGGLGSAGSVYTAINSFTAAASPVIATACAEYNTARGAANAVLGSGMVPAAYHASVVSIESYGDAACANPPAGDPLSTAIWLGQLVGQITTLTGAKTG